MAKGLFLFVCLAFFGCSTQSQLRQPADLSLDMSQFQAFDDLSDVATAQSIPILDQASQKVSLVGVGESVHASGGFHQAKVRLIQYLVRRRGFRIVLLETPIVGAEKASEFIAKGQGTAKAAVQGFYGVWRGEEILELVQWCRDYNAQHPSDPVFFSGFDIRQGYADMEFLVSRLQSRADQRAHALSKSFAACFVPKESGAFFSFESEIWHKKRKISEGEIQWCRKTLEEAEKYFDSQRQKNRLSNRDLLWALIHISNLRSWISMMDEVGKGTPRADSKRELGLAFNLKSLPEALTGFSQKAVFIAHNLHVVKDLQGLSSTEIGFNHFRSMGSILREEMGAKYVAVGLLAYEVGMNFPGQKEKLVFQEGPHTLEYHLNSLNRKYLLFSPERALPGGIKVAFGTLFREDSYEGNPVYFEGDLAKQFDLVFFLQKSWPMKQVPRQ